MGALATSSLVQSGAVRPWTRVGISSPRFDPTRRSIQDSRHVLHSQPNAASVHVYSTNRAGAAWDSRDVMTINTAMLAATAGAEARDLKSGIETFFETVKSQ